LTTPLDSHSTGELSELLDVSQHGEAGILAAVVGPDWPRYLVDIGAHDGRSLSNSFPFLRLGWAGLLVEPLPEAFTLLAERYRGRDDVTCVQAACAAPEGEMPLFVGSDGPLPMTSSLLPRGGASVTVRTRTLTGLLDEFDVPRDFSLLLVDTEGSDADVLSGLDFARFRPRAIVTEDDATDPAGRAAKYSLLEDRGYVLYTVVAGTNSIWLAAELATHAAPLTPEEAMRTVSRGVLERRCAELERSREEIWQRLAVVHASRSWRLTRPLRAIARKLRRR
jgi:FkbM family methyltransferase